MNRSHYDICADILRKSKDMADIEEPVFGKVTPHELAWLAADAVMACPDCGVDLQVGIKEACSMCEYINAVLQG